MSVAKASRPFPESTVDERRVALAEHTSPASRRWSERSRRDEGSLLVGRERPELRVFPLPRAAPAMNA